MEGTGTLPVLASIPAQLAKHKPQTGQNPQMPQKKCNGKDCQLSFSEVMKQVKQKRYS